jgi:large subunit ribosomal protein L9
MKVMIKATGEVKNVALGYAVNYLLPKKLAVLATPKRLQQYQQAQQAQKEKQEEAVKQERQQAERLNGKVIEFKKETVTKKKIATRLKIPKTSVRLAEPLRQPGEYPVELKFGRSQAKIKVRLI